MKYNYIVIDTSNLFWRSIIFSLEKTVNIENYVIYNNTIINFFDKLKELKDKFAFDDSKIYFLIDNPESHIQIREILSGGEYKHSRKTKNLPKNIYKTLNILRELLKNYSDNFFVVQCDILEADDLTYPLYKTFNLLPQERCLFISADMDWARNINENCDWYNYYTVHNEYTFKMKYGFYPKGKTIQMWKALKGDNSDCIPNAIPYLPNEILLDILNRFKDINDLYKNLWNQDYPTQWKIKLKEAELNIRMNYQLVDFIEPDKNIDNYIFKCKENLKKLEFWYKVLSIPFEPKMLLKKQSNNDFFEKKKYKRI